MIQPVSVGSGVAAWMDADVQRLRLPAVEVRASKMHGGRAVPRGSVTTTHNRLRPNKAQMPPVIKSNQSLNSSNRPVTYARVLPPPRPNLPPLNTPLHTLCR